MYVLISGSVAVVTPIGGFGFPWGTPSKYYQQYLPFDLWVGANEFLFRNRHKKFHLIPSIWFLSKLVTGCLRGMDHGHRAHLLRLNLLVPRQIFSPPDPHRRQLLAVYVY